MKTINASQTNLDLESVLNAAQKERVVVTRNGKPSAVVLGIESYDAEDLHYATSEDFWRLIESRRSGPSIPLSELRARLNIKPKSSRPKKARPSGKRSRASPSAAKSRR